jgi:hypothetical protein
VSQSTPIPLLKDNEKKLVDLRISLEANAIDQVTAHEDRRALLPSAVGRQWTEDNDSWLPKTSTSPTCGGLPQGHTRESCSYVY